MASPDYIAILAYKQALHEKKSAGYSPGENPWQNFYECERFGVPAHIGCLIRASDKWVRLANLMNGAGTDEVGESIIDTALDLAAYMEIFIILYRIYMWNTHQVELKFW